MKKIIALCLIVSSNVFASDVLLSEYLKEIDPHIKSLKLSKAVLEPISDKKIEGKKLTEKELDKSMMIACFVDNTYKKIIKISTKPKYKNLKKAQKMAKASENILKNFSTIPKRSRNS